MSDLFSSLGVRMTQVMQVANIGQPEVLGLAIGLLALAVLWQTGVFGILVDLYEWLVAGRKQSR